MKFVPVLSFLSVGLMVVIITQAVWQELNLHSLKGNTEKNSARIKSKEEAIIKVKSDIQDLKNAVGILNNKKFEVMEQKGEMLRRAADMDAKLETCHTDKEDSVRKKTEMSDSLTKVKAEQDEEKQKAQVEIQQLKQQILNRDRAICTFVDTTNEEGRKLCANA